MSSYIITNALENETNIPTQEQVKYAMGLIEKNPVFVVLSSYLVTV